MTDNDLAFLRDLDALAQATSLLDFVYITRTNADRLNALNGEGAYQHHSKMHGFRRDQLLNLVESALRKQYPVHATVAKALSTNPSV